MIFNLNEFLMSLSFALDFIEMDVLGLNSNHGKRVAYISFKVAEEMKFTKEELSDIVALAILHDNGISEFKMLQQFHNKASGDIKHIEKIKDHCIIGEENIIQYPFLTNVKDVIKYHHESYDCNGFFHLKADEIPLMSQIIYMADVIETAFDLSNTGYSTEVDIISFVKNNSNIKFSKDLVEAFLNVSKNKSFWLDMHNNFLNIALNKIIPKYNLELSIDEVEKVTKVFSKIIDSKSPYTQRHSQGLSEKAGIMADYYNYNNDFKTKLIIAANLHDIGKLGIPNEILDKPDKLDITEFEIIKQHTYYTRLALQEIQGFEEITEWASNHHEKLNGKGYPYGLNAEKLDFNSRLLGCLDVYQALTEERPYRKSLSHKETMSILHDMANEGYIEGEIVKDIHIVFGE